MAEQVDNDTDKDEDLTRTKCKMTNELKDSLDVERYTMTSKKFMYFYVFDTYHS